jgi:hypothetical protein
MADKFVATNELGSWLAALSDQYRTLVPRREGDAVVFQPFEESRPVELDARPTKSPKEAVFPQCEALLTFAYNKNPETPGRVEVAVTEKMGGRTHGRGWRTSLRRLRLFHL